MHKPHRSSSPSFSGPGESGVFFSPEDRCTKIAQRIVSVALFVRDPRVKGIQHIVFFSFYFSALRPLPLSSWVSAGPD